MLIIPHSPDVLRLPVCRLWNGMPCLQDSLVGFVLLNQNKDGFLIETSTLVFSTQKEPATKEHWETSVQGHNIVKIFFVEQGNQYLEVCLDVAGSYRVCGFDEGGILLTDFSEILFSFEHVEENHQWVNRLCIPWDYFPT